VEKSVEQHTLFMCSGGISLKTAMKMDTMRADMMGAAMVLASAYGKHVHA
jgi:leucyl aminopeptidase